MAEGTSWTAVGDANGTVLTAIDGVDVLLSTLAVLLLPACRGAALGACTVLGGAGGATATGAAAVTAGAAIPAI